MINFRTIFNPTYSYLGLILIILLIIAIILMNNNLKSSFKIIGNTFLISGTITLLVALMINTSINILITSPYKIFIQVISNNLWKNLIYGTILSILSGVILIIISHKIKLEKIK